MKGAVDEEIMEKVYSDRDGCYGKLTNVMLSVLLRTNFKSPPGDDYIFKQIF